MIFTEEMEKLTRQYLAMSGPNPTEKWNEVSWIRLNQLLIAAAIAEVEKKN